jgi:hypothetical protein
VDDQLNPEPDNTPAPNVCISCGSPAILPGYPNKLCAPCRDKFIKFNVPAWVKLFGAGIVVIMLISINWLPGNLKAALALARGENAELNHNYITEQNELEKAKKLVPGSIDILAHLMIASFNNDDFKTVFAVSNDLEHKSIEDTVLFNKLNDIIARTKDYFPSDTLTKMLGIYKKTTVPDTAYQRYLKKFPMDVFALFSLASSYSDNEKYKSADSLLSTLLTIDREYTPALILKTIVKRELSQPDSSIYYCDKMLQNNRQSLFALSSKSRTLLKTGKNQEGLKLAEECYDLKKSMPYNLATLAIAYHFNKDYKQRDAMIAIAAKDSTSNAYMQYAKDIISNKIKFQN